MSLRGLASFENGSLGDTNYTDEVDSSHLWDNSATSSAGIVAGGKFGRGYEFIVAEAFDWFDDLYPITESYVTFWVNIPDDGQASGCILTATDSPATLLRLSGSKAKLTLIDTDDTETDVAGSLTYPRGVKVFNRVRIWVDASNEISCVWEWNDGSTSETISNLAPFAASNIGSAVFVNGWLEGAGETGFNATYDDIAVWSGATDVPDVSPLPTTPVETDDITAGGSLALSGDMTILLSPASISGSIALIGGMTAEIEQNTVVGSLALSGSMTSIFTRNEISGGIALSGTMSAEANVPAEFSGILALSGTMDTQRINKDVYVGGTLALSGAILVSTEGKDCSIPEFNNTRWC